MSPVHGGGDEEARLNGQVFVDDARLALDEWRRQQGLGPSPMDDVEIMCEAVIMYAHQLRRGMRPIAVDEIVLIARCPEHGLHGARSECFVCGGPVEQVPMREVA